MSLSFTQQDPLGEYRWIDFDRQQSRAAEAVWSYGGADKNLSAQILAVHWKACIAVVRRWNDDATLADVKVCILGPVTTPRLNHPSSNVEITAIRLNPESVSGILDMKLDDIQDQDIVLDHGDELQSLRRLAEAGAKSEHLAAELIRFVEHRALAKTSTQFSNTAMLAHWIRQTDGARPISSFSEQTNTSERQLRRQFKADIGLSPKAYARTVRFHRTQFAADKSANPEWARIAADLSYYDQSHLIREAAALVGETPAQLHRRRTGQV
ncbi:MAG: helix-turn-helix domain-containing protein [Henriciella sp.]|nr:helix-turn-helix domain-containing protein [Henriciella sp.]